MLDYNLYMLWYIKLKDKQSKFLNCKHWEIKRGNHKGLKP